MTSDAISPMDLPWLRSETIIEPKSCTVPMNIEPKMTRIIAGTQPQMIAIAGPTTGSVPTIDAKWCPKRIFFLVGTKSTLSCNSLLGQIALEFNLKILLARNLPYI